MYGLNFCNVYELCNKYRWFTEGTTEQYKAAAAGIMSTEACVGELYGNDKDKEWKEEEVRRIKEEKGIIEADEPSVGDEIFAGVE